MTEIQLPHPKSLRDFDLSQGRGKVPHTPRGRLSLGRGQNCVAVLGEGTALARHAIVAAARSWLGTPYVHQASAKGAGTDCLGLIRGVWRDLYGAEPEIPPPYGPDWNERAWFRSAREEPLLAAARRHLAPRSIAEEKPGDVLVFRVVRDGPAKHCGILTGKDRFIHAYAGRVVVESWLSRWWRERLAGVFGFPGAEE